MVYRSTEISDYAFKKFFDDRFDEVEAEYMVRMRRQRNMIIEEPKEIQELRKKCKPYMDGAALKTDAPEEIKKAAAKIRKWAFDQGQ